MNIQMKKRLERLELKNSERRKKHTTTLDEDALVSALTVALRDYPEEFVETLRYLANGRLGDAKNVLEHLTTGDEDKYVLTPQAVGGLIHLFMHGALDTGGNIADRIREPLIEYTNNKTLQETIVVLLKDFTGNLDVFRDHPVAFACICMNGGHGFRIDG